MMTILNLQFRLPERLALSAFDVKMTLAAKLYEEGKVTSGQAAEMVGITKREFIETVGQYGVSIFQATPDEAENDHQANVKRINERSEKKCAVFN